MVLRPRQGFVPHVAAVHQPRTQLGQPVRVQVHLDVVTSPDRVLPLPLHAGRELGLVLAQKGVLAELGEDRQARALALADVQQRVGWPKDVGVPVDPSSRRHRLPGLVVECQRCQSSSWADQQHQVLTVQELVSFDHELALDQRAQLGWAGAFPIARTPRGDEREAVALEVFGDPAQRSALAGLLDVVDDVAERDHVKALSIRVGTLERVD